VAGELTGEAVAISLALIALLGGYLLNERASRRSFEREKRYDRASQVYEQLLKVLRDLFRATRISHAQATLQIRSSAINPPPNEEILDMAIGGIGLSELSALEETSQVAALLMIPKQERAADWRHQVRTALAILSSGTWHRSQQSFNDALSALILMDASEAVRKKALSVYDGLDEFAGKLSEALTKAADASTGAQVAIPPLPILWFDQETDDLLTLMKNDLGRILGNRTPDTREAG